MILSERGATLDDTRSVPDDLRRAREAAASDEGRQGTEGMRRAMVHYKGIVDDAVGHSPKKADGEYRGEVPSRGKRKNNRPKGKGTSPPEKKCPPAPEWPRA